jgi:hypothetical protein
MQLVILLIWYVDLDVSEVKLPGEAKQNNVPPKFWQPNDGGCPLHWMDG